MRRAVRALDAASPPAALMLLVVLATAIGMQGSASTQTAVVNALINLVLVVGLYVFVGNSGVFSFGQMSFMALGGYLAAWLTLPPELKALLLPGLPGFLADASLSPVQAVLVAAGVGAVAAVITAVPLMRLSGLGAALATFALLGIVYTVTANLDSWTRGASGLSGVPVTVTSTGALVCGLVAIALAWAYQQTSSALRLRASREDEVAARAAGVRVSLDRTVAWTISGALVAAGGALYAQQIGNIGPTAFYLDPTFLTLVMLIVGGRTSLTGAVIGTLLVSVVDEFLRQLQDGTTILGIEIAGRPGIEPVGLGLLMLVALLWRPDGLTGGRELRPVSSWRRPSWSRRRRPGKTAGDVSASEAA